MVWHRQDTVNLLYEALVQKLSVTSYYCASSLAAIELSKAPLMPSSVLVALYDIRNPPRFEGIANWIAKQAIRSAATDFELFLVGCGLLLSSAGLSVNPRKMRDCSLRERLNLLEDVGCASKFAEHLVTLQSVRNCIVHRDGFVSKKDVNNGAALCWMLLRLVADKSHPTQTTFTLAEEKLEYALGSSLSFGPDVVNDALLTVWHAAHDFSMRVHEAVQLKGLDAGPLPQLPGIVCEVVI